MLMLTLNRSTPAIAPAPSLIRAGVVLALGTAQTVAVWVILRRKLGRMWF